MSLERLVEESRREYYAALLRSSKGWHDGRHDLLPWLDFFLDVLLRAFRMFAGNAQATLTKGGKTALVESAFAALPGRFTFADLARACPGVSHDMVRLVLREIRASGRVACEGRGPGARWRKKG